MQFQISLGPLLVSLIIMLSKVLSLQHVARRSISRGGLYVWHNAAAFHQSCSALSAKDDSASADPWITVNLATSKEKKDMNMKKRIEDAKSSFTNFRLDEKDSSEFDRMLGIDEDLITRSKPKRTSSSSSSSSSSSRGPKASYSNIRNKFESKDSKKKLRLELDKVTESSDLPNKFVRGFLEMNPFICSGCGSAFQSKNEINPGYLPTDKFQEHREKAEIIRQQQEAIKILESADVDLDSPSAESLLRVSGMTPETIAGIKKIGVQSRESEENGDSKERPVYDEEVCICQRCFRLQQYGQVEQALRPGWSENQLLTPERFESLLGSIKTMETVVLCIVDIFDLQGSVVPNLKQIAGPNPVMIAVNKIDLLPKDISKVRVTNWVYSEIKRICGFVNPSDDRYFGKQGGSLKMSNIHLISCQSDFGIEGLMSDVIPLSEAYGNKVHVMGAANVGKSSFINRLLTPTKVASKKHNNSKKKKGPMVTVSNLPGTTLDFLKIKLPNGVTMIDTPGLINIGHLTSKLSTTELKQVIPSKPINPVTFRVEEGKCILMGGLARFEMLEGRPFHFTFFVSNEIKLHQTDSTRADEFLSKHIGKLISPPETVERMAELGPLESTEFEIQGDGWVKSSEDIVIPGLGWIAVTGVGAVKVRISAPAGTVVSTRSSLLPYESQHSTAKFTGGKILKKSGKPGQTYGWRS